MKKNPLPKILLLLLNTAILYAVLRLLTEWSERAQNPAIYYITTAVYALATAVVFVIYYVKNGFSFGKEHRTREELPEKWTEEEKDEFMRTQPARKESAKKMLFVLLPLCLTMLISLIELNLFS